MGRNESEEAFMKWTSEQQKVIDLRDRDILVSAAAGSGKTAVLVERIIKRITDEEQPVDIDRLLVVTFTKAAAAEMRERIGNAIDEQCERFPMNAHLRRQSALIHNAMITTIDSFCLFVVRNHFEEIDLDPNFRIADEGEMKLLEQDVMAQVFEENYGQKSERFLRLIDTYAGKRNDAQVRDMVAKLYRMSQSSPWPEEWVAGLQEPYQAKDKQALLHTPIIEDITGHVRLLLMDMRNELEGLLSLCLAPDGPAAYAAAVEADKEAFSGVEELQDYESLSQFFAELSFARLAPLRKFEGDVQKKEAVRSGRDGIKKEIQKLQKNYFSRTPEELLSQLGRLRPHVEELVHLTLQYMEAMAQAKRRKRIVDFSDIEHFALRILVDEGTRKTRSTAEEFRAHFAEIMIDEYQDSNQVQEEIMRAISREESGGHNLFMVGDVKQSIYRFRLARPELFMEKYALFSTEDGVQQRIDLHNNFRSRPEVLDFCNDIFYKIMSPDLGRVAYDADAALYGKASYPESPGMEAELLLLDEADELLPEGTDENKRQLEARLVASRIRRLMKETQVTDKASGQLRPLRYSDIVILFRSLKGWGTDFVEILASQGIPAYVESSTGYFSAIEVQTVLSLLRILDNPYQDIPMAAVLRSPIVGLDDEELAQIRISDPNLPFAAAALQNMREAEEGALYDFYQKYTSLRAQRDLPIHELLQKLLDVTGYGNYAAALPAGEKRAANLAMLIEKAVDYEKTSYRGLFHFVRYIDQLQKYEIDFGEADTIGENADVVRIMTIHKSKGLEFPVVFVSGLSKPFNQMDTNDRLVVHPDLGMGLVEIEGQPKVKKNSLFRSQIADRLRRENQGEELRILYVALTRAKEKLILSGVIKDEAKTLSSYTGNVLPGKPISYRARVGASAYLDWIFPAMLSYPQKYTIAMADPGALVWESIAEHEKNRMDRRQLMRQIKQADEDLVEQYDILFSYEYPFQSEAGKKSKYSVSELKHDSMVRRYDRMEGEAEVPEFLLEEREPYVPDFAKAEGRASADTSSHDRSDSAGPGAKRGTAVHRVMECLDFEALSGVDRRSDKAVEAFVQSELARMLASGDLPAEWHALVPPAMIESFAKSPVAGRMAEAAVRGDLYREKPFVMQHEDVLVQGIIDAFWLEKDALVLLDYKTDRVQTADELVLRYRTQLELYADALARVFSSEKQQRTAQEKLLYSFRLQEVIAV